MKRLICTTYNQLSDGSLQLYNNWTEEYSKEKLLSWGIDPYILYDTKGNAYEYDSIGISPILEGKLENSKTIIHVRIVKHK